MSLAVSEKNTKLQRVVDAAEAWVEDEQSVTKRAALGVAVGEFQALRDLSAGEEPDEEPCQWCGQPRHMHPCSEPPKPDEEQPETCEHGECGVPLTMSEPKPEPDEPRVFVRYEPNERVSFAVHEWKRVMARVQVLQKDRDLWDWFEENCDYLAQNTNDKWQCSRVDDEEWVDDKDWPEADTPRSAVAKAREVEDA